MMFWRSFPRFPFFISSGLTNHFMLVVLNCFVFFPAAIMLLFVSQHGGKLGRANPTLSPSPDLSAVITEGGGGGLVVVVVVAGGGETEKGRR